jgi:hypothetical protein
MQNRTRILASLAAAGLAAATLVGGATAASAHDHLNHAAGSEGADDRGFVNPVAGNPSGQSGAASQPGTVPGLGDPTSGTSTGTPSFSCETLLLRLAARSEGAGPTCG